MAHYRVASESPLARLLFDELNHSVTPGGHRVTVYWDAHRLVRGQDWEEGFSRGLLNSLCMLPLLSYGATAPLAALPGAAADRKRAVDAGWGERPCGRTRLTGGEDDPDDNVLKEFTIAGALLERCDAADREPGELGILRAAFPVLVGRMQPAGSAEYPRMGDFFQVQGGGGKYASLPSPASARAAGRFLRDKARLPEAAVRGAETRSVAAVVQGLTSLQGCQLWAQAVDLEGGELHKDQLAIVGSGYAGPPVDLRPPGGVAAAVLALTDEQRRLCSGGLDLQQAKMLKALVKANLASFHDVIDRAVDAHKRSAGGGPAAPNPSSGVSEKHAAVSGCSVTCELVMSASPSLHQASSPS